jgi:hypothetical protein
MQSGYTPHRELYDFLYSWYDKKHGRQPSTQIAILLCDFALALNERSNSTTKQNES